MSKLPIEPDKVSQLIMRFDSVPRVSADHKINANAWWTNLACGVVNLRYK